MESKRQYKYIVLAVGIIAFAILSPVTLKLLPKILGNQLKGDLSSLFVLTPKSAINDYIKNLFQIGTLFTIFTLGSILLRGEKASLSGIITIIITFLSAAFVNLNTIGKFMPYKLVEGANLFTLKGYLYTLVLWWIKN